MVQSNVYPIPKPGHLQRDRSYQVSPFEIVGNDYAGRLYYSFKGKKDLKAYILLFSCIVSTGVHLELVSNLSATEFIKSFKKLISRRGNANIIYSDNTETLRAGAKWLNSINRDEKFHEILSKEKIIWKFNLSRALLWER